MPALPDPNAVRKWHEKNALRGVGVFSRAERAAAKQDAAQAAQTELDDRWRHAQAEQAQAQQELDNQWARLIGNDPDTVLATLAEAFEDNEAPAAPVGIDGSVISLIVLVPDEAAIPERLPATTQAGNLTLRKLPKGERSAFYLLLIAGYVLVTLREAFAVAPGVNAARVIAVRRSDPDIYGRAALDCMAAGRWTRTISPVRQSGAASTSTRCDVRPRVARCQVRPLPEAARCVRCRPLKGVSATQPFRPLRELPRYVTPLGRSFKLPELDPPPADVGPDLLLQLKETIEVGLLEVGFWR
jgi:hypothetical protein